MLADHVKPAGLTRKENAVFILSAVTAEPARSASDQRMWASGGIDWRRIERTRTVQMIYCGELRIILIGAGRTGAARSQRPLTRR
jgi:hypothetical protein